MQLELQVRVKEDVNVSGPRLYIGGQMSKVIYSMGSSKVTGEKNDLGFLSIEICPTSHI